jgi:hypothetical protein
MPAFKPRAMSGDLARLYVLEAYIETLKAENESLKRQLAAAETWAAQAVITKRLDTLATDRRDTLAAEPEPRRSWLRYWFGWRAQASKSVFERKCRRPSPGPRALEPARRDGAGSGSHRF